MASKVRFVNTTTVDSLALPLSETRRKDRATSIARL